MAAIGCFTRFLHYPGGSENVTALLKKALESNGHHVEIVAAENFSLRPLDKVKRRLIGEPAAFSSHFQSHASRFDLLICSGEFGYGVQHPRCINVFHGSAYGYREAVKPYLGPRSSPDFCGVVELCIYDENSRNPKDVPLGELEEVARITEGFHAVIGPCFDRLGLNRESVPIRI